ncbi:FtsX-like permease family protein [Cytobacillus horneckiae]|uniref:ABC transporter permease n=1 Tax=Cytobacillus horneckiae TaxID=549687 RepID=A0A2N0ZJ09_9BACI|nr:ABC transporter permease [Cytobacillus horneckiae]MEC1158984.1 ABC transporter permease [Cytobacillus horneckiae]MED2937938.1 ABC transporter permease [Cytobacillus horneckiae]PKG29495.1 ABC transporter permease [Cytobacillus horneckiae]
MTLFDLALKNIRRNMKSYSLYIGSTIFSIIIYFTFVTLKYSEDISSLAETSKQISSIMSASAFVLMIFVAIFIAYSNSFFMKKRKKEVALYSLLGVRKRSIGFMLFFENMVIGLLSLVVGVGLGFLLSRALLTILMKLMGLDIVIGFAFSIDAVINTLIVFFIIFLFTSMQGYRVIYQFKLIDLFHAEKKGEELPKARMISAILGVVTLATAYWLALQDLTTSPIWRMLSLAMPIVIIALTVIGSALIFNSVLVYMLSIMKNNKRWAWKGLNLMTSSQLLYRIRGNAKTLTIIATLSATTITAGGAVFGLYYNADKNVQTYTPYTFMWEGAPQEIDPHLIEHAETVHSKTLRIEQGAYEMEYAVIKQSTFEKLAKNLDWSDIQVAKDEEVLMIDAFYNEQWSQKVDSVMIDGTEYKVAKLYDKAVFNTFTIGASAIVVTDKLYSEITADEKTYQAVQVKDYKNQLALSEELAAKTENFSSATEDYRASIEASGALLFVGSFLGLVFLVATGSIIFFKMMTDAEEDKGKYAVLYKIGVSKREMKRTIRSQVGMIFAAPLGLGLLHGAVALTAFSNLLMMNLLVPVLIWMLAYTLIYTIYYFITVRSFNKTVH